MNKLISIASLLLAFGFVNIVSAAKPVFITRSADGDYAINHSSISISSQTVTTIDAKDGYRTMEIQFEPTNLQGGTSVFYTFDASTANIFTTGQMVYVSTPNPGAYHSWNSGNKLVLESNTALKLMTKDHPTNILAKVLQFEK